MASSFSACLFFFFFLLHILRAFSMSLDGVTVYFFERLNFFLFCEHSTVCFSVFLDGHSALPSNAAVNSLVYTNFRKPCRGQRKAPGSYLPGFFRNVVAFSLAWTLQFPSCSSSPWCLIPERFHTSTQPIWLVWPFELLASHLLGDA